MSDGSGTSPHAPQYYLKTFGTVALVGPGNQTVLGSHGHHRRRLALMAVLAAAGDRGRSRDQLLLLFWPDTTQSRARHSLDQLLYALRGSIGESVLAGGNPVRLDPAAIGSDIAAFDAALDRGDLEDAVAAYRGVFLDGFYVSDAPEFERWVESERARLGRGYSDALERLARRGEAAGDHPAAVRWWRKLAETDPLSSAHAAGLIRALMHAGDYPAALHYAERYTSIVAQELGTGVGPAVTALVAELRTKAASPTRSPPDASQYSAESPAYRASVPPIRSDVAPVDLVGTRSRTLDEGQFGPSAPPGAAARHHT